MDGQSPSTNSRIAPLGHSTAVNETGESSSQIFSATLVVPSPTTSDEKSAREIAEQAIQAIGGSNSQAISLTLGEQNADSRQSESAYRILVFISFMDALFI